MPILYVRSTPDGPSAIVQLAGLADRPGFSLWQQLRILRTRSVMFRFIYFRRFLDPRLLALILVSAEPLCMAKWSVLSLLIKYCGSSFEAWTV